MKVVIGGHLTPRGQKIARDARLRGLQDGRGAIEHFHAACTLKMVPSTQQEGREFVRLEFPGPIPSKKNKLRPGRGGGRGQHYDVATKGAIDALATLARIQWGTRKPVVHPSIGLELEYVDGSQDRDGIYTTLLDALKKGGVIVDDSIKFFNGPVTKYPAVKSGRLFAVITLGLEAKSND